MPPTLAPLRALRTATMRSCAGGTLARARRLSQVPSPRAGRRLAGTGELACAVSEYDRLQCSSLCEPLLASAKAMFRAQVVSIRPRRSLKPLGELSAWTRGVSLSCQAREVRKVTEELEPLAGRSLSRTSSVHFVVVIVASHVSPACMVQRSAICSTRPRSPSSRFQCLSYWVVCRHRLGCSVGL